MEHATAARRIIEAAPPNTTVLEFGARRADGLEAALDSSVYGIMAGCTATSNVLAAQLLGITPQGTHAHSWVEAFPNEYEAFCAYALKFPNNCTLLVDTYDTLNSGLPNAIKTFQFMQANGLPTNHIGIRIDSGDLAYLSKVARKKLDQAGFPQATICLSNGLTAETIESLVAQGACFNSLGVGDNISKPTGRMGCVYKLVALKENEHWIPKIKLSNDTVKIVNPDYKNLYRAYTKDGDYAIADIITQKHEHLDPTNLNVISLADNFKQKELTNFYLQELQVPIFINGQLVYQDPDIWTKQQYCHQQMSHLYQEVKRTTMPEEYYLDGTENYINFKNNFITKTKKLIKKD